MSHAGIREGGGVGGGGEVVGGRRGWGEVRRRRGGEREEGYTEENHRAFAWGEQKFRFVTA